MLTDLAQLRTFVVVAEEEHLTRAAERLNMSPSAASAHVRAIEDHLGSQLFVRTNRNLELTRAGQLLSQKAKTLLREEALFTSFARELKGNIEGQIVIGTSSEPGTGIGAILATLRANHPLISLNVIARASSGTRQGVMSGELDVGLLLGQPVEPSFTYYELTKVRYKIVGPARWKEQIDAADWTMLAALPWLTPSASSAYSAMLAQLFDNRGLELNSVIQFDNSSVARAALKAGAGMVLLREDHAIEGEKEGYLAISPLATEEVALSIAYQSARTHDPLIQAFLEAARTSWPNMTLLPRHGTVAAGAAEGE